MEGGAHGLLPHEATEKILDEAGVRDALLECLRRACEYLRAEVARGGGGLARSAARSVLDHWRGLGGPGGVLGVGTLSTTPVSRDGCGARGEGGLSGVQA